MNLTDFALSLIRTYVPVAMGAALTWLARKFGFILPSDLSAQATIAVTGLVVAVYYTAVRALEMKWPAAGRLLGAAKPPAYNPPTDTNAGGTP